MKTPSLAQKLLVLTIAIAAVCALVGIASFARPAVASPPPPAEPVTVQAVASQGNADVGNNLSVNFLVVVTDATGTPVNNLVQADFSLINHYMLPGQACSFSNNITFFSNAGTGAYRIRVAPVMCNWVAGDHLVQIRVTSGVQQGQTVATLSIQ